MKTVKELETQLNISKVSIYMMLKKEEFKHHVFKGANNITLVDDIGEELLKAYYLKEQGEQLKNIVNDELQHNEASTENKEDSKDINKDDLWLNNADIIRILQQQIDTKDEQINNLLNIVLNQQKLQGVQLITDNQTTVHSDEVPPEPTKRGFFKNLFKK